MIDLDLEVIQDRLNTRVRFRGGKMHVISTSSSMGSSWLGGGMILPLIGMDTIS